MEAFGYRLVGEMAFASFYLDNAVAGVRLYPVTQKYGPFFTVADVRFLL